MARTGAQMAIRNARGLTSVVGFAASMGMLAAASLAAIPAMINASSAAAWGAIALGQGIGAVAAVMVAYGWGLSGPAVIAAAGPTGRRTEYLASVRVKRLLFPVAAVLAAGISALIARELWMFGLVGALSATSIGLTANWFFVGLGRPYVLLLVETMPRVVGTGIGIGVMALGGSALVGVLAQFAGMLTAFTTSTLWILRHTSGGSQPQPTVRETLRSQRHGSVSTLVSAAYVSAPLVIVSTFAPVAQPLYALADKVQRQISVALGPLVTVQQGWVPRAKGEQLYRRARLVLLVGAAVAVSCGLAVVLGGPVLMDWLGGGELVAPWPVLVLMAAFVTLSVYESMVSKVVLAALHRIPVVSRATGISAAVGLPMVAAGAVWIGASGALVGVVTGLVVRLVLELVPAVSQLRRAPATAPVELVAEPADA